MNALPINKIMLASVAFAFMNWKKILEISILPVLISIPFLTILPDMFNIMNNVFSNKGFADIQLPDNMMIYLLLFCYGYLTLSINVYRLVILGQNSVSGIVPELNFNKIIRFVGLTLFIGLVTMAPVIISGIAFLQLIMYFLVIPIALNFINIAIDQPSKYKWHLNFFSQANLFFLQIVLPALASMIFSFLVSLIGLPDILGWVVKIIVFYWTLISLALCYQIIVK
ncbi:hypothetical protein Rmag_0761 [Candidatus Ruthia magnifica str. Cm (Calyptogena magnifica)]|uniref:Uncharacterized protein n=1 Tax=Ruthia magnifica subsp. Calyptogena magnifica TaxID=413404 RepID=A1AX31_RUTMC|nr:hypothetical protein [Candidatus Ruthturnera calyptogenae]ABL02488.1 hypothetical protein Rmag_0761 [Candidatus Ruthia magnifica str. Cm (Calyptogena magnifica)]